MLRTMLMVAALAWAPAAFAKAPAGQGRACDARHACSDGLTCVAKHGGGSTCELACASNATCPEDQRCVKDGAQRVCRPINDGVGL